MRLALRIIAAILMGMGIVWILQGVGVLPGSFMSGQIQWAYRGAGCAIAGAILMAISLRRR